LFLVAAGLSFLFSVAPVGSEVCLQEADPRAMQGRSEVFTPSGELMRGPLRLNSLHTSIANAGEWVFRLPISIVDEGSSEERSHRHGKDLHVLFSALEEGHDPRKLIGVSSTIGTSNARVSRVVS
jgi:hypothetical protein